jgi:hypothetical protein
MATLLLLVIIGGLSQTETPTNSAVSSPVAFERLSRLVGQWKGSFQWSGGRHDSGPMVASYYLTGAGSAIVENLGTDSTVSMTSVYHLDGPDLRMTHYCAAKNQPRLKATHGDDRHIQFAFLDATNLASLDAPHVTGFDIQFRNDHEITLIFTFSTGGAESHERIDLTRAVVSDAKKSFGPPRLDAPRAGVGPTTSSNAAVALPGHNVPAYSTVP